MDAAVLAVTRNRERPAASTSTGNFTLQIDDLPVIIGVQTAHSGLEEPLHGSAE